MLNDQEATRLHDLQIIRDRDGKAFNPNLAKELAKLEKKESGKKPAAAAEEADEAEEV